MEDRPRARRPWGGHQLVPASLGREWDLPDADVRDKGVVCEVLVTSHTHPTSNCTSLRRSQGRECQISWRDSFPLGLCTAQMPCFCFFY